MTTSETLREGTWNPQRVMEALGRIGYEPPSAVMDLADNSLSAGATRIDITIETRQDDREGPGRRRTFLSGFQIADNGSGMAPDELEEAITLGSSTARYSEHTLSKFGLGLKSASASLGRRVTLISRAAGGQPAHTLVLDHDLIAEHGRYVYTLAEGTEEEVALLSGTAGHGPGTVVRVDKVHERNMPAPADVMSALKSRAGVVYYFALTGIREEPQVVVTVNGDALEPIDPLFVSSIPEDGGDLDERSWDGLGVRWIQRPQVIQLNEDGQVTATVTMTQLPHPPSVARSGAASQARVREQYLIGAGNYGFYIYRNGRLIEWAESLGMVPQDQDLYAFRGRLEITSDADDILNLDVTKSRLHLSDIAHQQLLPLLQEGVKKSRLAWVAAKGRIASEVSDTPHDTVNEELNRIGELEEDEDRLDEEAAPEEERQRLRQRREEATNRNPVTPEEGERLREEAKRVQYLPSLENNQLWERAHDPALGLIVRVNQSHRFIRELVQSFPDNAALIQALDLLFFGLARGEFNAIYRSDLDNRVVEDVLQEFRERVGEGVSEILRRLDIEKLLGLSQ